MAQTGSRSVVCSGVIHEKLTFFLSTNPAKVCKITRQSIVSLQDSRMFGVVSRDLHLLVLSLDVSGRVYSTRISCYGLFEEKLVVYLQIWSSRPTRPLFPVTWDEGGIGPVSSTEETSNDCVHVVLPTGALLTNRFTIGSDEAQLLVLVHYWLTHPVKDPPPVTLFMVVDKGGSRWH